jgi:hypothetical protein
MSARCRSVVAPANALSRESSSATVSRRSSGEPASQRHRSQYSICTAGSLKTEETISDMHGPEHIDMVLSRPARFSQTFDMRSPQRATALEVA